MAINDFFSIIKDICLSGAAITTATVAWRGLSSWKKELKGKAKFEVGRGLILATYKLRDAVESCRNPFLSAIEYPKEYQTDKKERTSQDEGRAITHIYGNRFKKVSECNQKFDMASLEAEALWGSPIAERVSKLGDCIRELNASIWMYTKNVYDGGETFKSDKEMADEIKMTVLSVNPKKNAFTIKTQKAVEEIENYIRPHLSYGSKDIEFCKIETIFETQINLFKKLLSKIF